MTKRLAIGVLLLCLPLFSGCSGRREVAAVPLVIREEVPTYLTEPTPAPMEGLAYYTQSLLALWPDKALVGSCVAGVVSLFGGDVYLLWMLAVMMVADFAFGVADAARRRHFRCWMLWHGALKFLYYMAYIGIVDMVNASLSRSFGGVYMPFLNLFIVYLIITDAVSVIAHMQRLGIPVPDLLRRVLLRSKRKVERRVDEAVGGEDDAP